LRKGYRVIGTEPSAGTVDLDRIRHLFGDIELVANDLQDQVAVNNILKNTTLTKFTILHPIRYCQVRFCTLFRRGSERFGVTRLLEAIRVTDPESGSSRLPAVKCSGR
jgi:GDP-D-mannose dehydratase